MENTKTKLLHEFLVNIANNNNIFINGLDLIQDMINAFCDLNNIKKKFGNIILIRHIVNHKDRKSFKYKNEDNLFFIENDCKVYRYDPSKHPYVEPYTPKRKPRQIKFDKLSYLRLVIRHSIMVSIQETDPQVECEFGVRFKYRNTFPTADVITKPKMLDVPSHHFFIAETKREVFKQIEIVKSLEKNKNINAVLVMFRNKDKEILKVLKELNISVLVYNIKVLLKTYNIGEPND
jgi:hypothetical protein